MFDYARFSYTSMCDRTFWREKRRKVNGRRGEPTWSRWRSRFVLAGKLRGCFWFVVCPPSSLRARHYCLLVELGDRGSTFRTSFSPRASAIESWWIPRALCYLIHVDLRVSWFRITNESIRWWDKLLHVMLTKNRCGIV